jgi:hypothetical protein
VCDDIARTTGFRRAEVVKMFALDADEMTDRAMTPMTFTKERLEQAKTRPPTVDSASLQERFDEFARQLWEARRTETT